jgi:hypothetical protein
MTDQILTGVVIGVAVPVSVILIRTISRWMARTISDQVVDAIGDSLQARWRKDIDEALEPIHAELRINGGTSMKDQVSSLGLRFAALEAQNHNFQGQLEELLTRGKES